MKKDTIRIIIKYIFLIVLAFAVLMPFIVMITNSFMHSSEIIANYSSEGNEYYKLSLIPQKVTLNQYYQVFFRRPTYIKEFWNSVILTFPTVIIQIIFSFMAAYAFAKIKFPGRDIIFAILLLIMLLPLQVTIVPNFMVLKSLKLIDKQIGIILIGTFAPLTVCLLRQYLRYISDEAMEAAKIDGASHIQIIFKIVLPQAKGGLAAAGIIAFIDSWNMVEQPLLFLSDVELMPLSVMITSFNQSSFGMAFAAGIVFMIPALIIFFLGQDYIITGIKLFGRK